MSRGSLRLDDSEAELTISPVQTTDEGEYKCEITFLDISKNCPVVQLVKLTTLAPPTYANISLSLSGTSQHLSRYKIFLQHTKKYFILIPNDNKNISVPSRATA